MARDEELAFGEWAILVLAGKDAKASRLSTGQQYLITNSPSEARTLLSIAVTAPGGDTFRRIWKIRHQSTPVIRLLGSPDKHGTFVGKRTQWSYPAAIEEGGKLYVSYSQGKGDCALSIIPLSALVVTNDEPEKN